MIVRSCQLPCILYRLTLHICQLLPCCSLVKRAMANILTSMLTTRHTTISSILASGLPTCNTLTSSLLLSQNQFTPSCLRSAGFIEITNCTCSRILMFPFIERSRRRYIRALHAYLISFTKRSQPLIDVESQQREAEAHFNTYWELDESNDWEEAQVKAPENGSGDGIWCAACGYSDLRVYLSSSQA